LPLILYDVPSRTACGLGDETVARLAELPGCIGLKDATGDIARPLRLRAMLGPQFRLLSGDDATALAFLAHGGDGCISVVSNVAPGLCDAMYLAWQEARIARAQELAGMIARLAAVLFRESNPVPAKYALSLMGIMPEHVRLPLVELQAATKAEIERVLAQVGAHDPRFLIGEIAPQDLGTARSGERARSKPRLVVA
jgi:4-hydroxy-tetrahydrodipicolinate synthase